MESLSLTGGPDRRALHEDGQQTARNKLLEAALLDSPQQPNTITTRDNPKDKSLTRPATLYGVLSGIPAGIAGGLLSHDERVYQSRAIENALRQEIPPQNFAINMDLLNRGDTRFIDKGFLELGSAREAASAPIKTTLKGTAKGLIAGALDFGIDTALQKTFGSDLFEPTTLEQVGVPFAFAAPLDMRLKLALTATAWLEGRAENYFWKRAFH